MRNIVEPREFKDYNEAEKLLNGKTYKEVRNILIPYDNSYWFRKEGVDPLTIDNAICSVKVEHYKGIGDYAVVTINLCGEKYEQLMKIRIIPKFDNAITIEEIASWGNPWNLGSFKVKE